MGLGGYLTWTAAAREISKKIPNAKFLPFEIHGKSIKLIGSPVFYNNPKFIQPSDELKDQKGQAIPFQLNNPSTNYCKQDTPERAIQRGDLHIIEQICEFYGVVPDELKCEIFLTEDELSFGQKLKKDLGNFITIEPHSKLEYTRNRRYSFEKWQNVVNALSEKGLKFVQVGIQDRPKLENVVDMRGKTSFREAAGIIKISDLFLSSEGGLVHAANAVDTKSVVILTGYQTYKMVAYPTNINVDISSHGPCGLKVDCELCISDVDKHDENEIVNIVVNELRLDK